MNLKHFGAEPFNARHLSERCLTVERMHRWHSDQLWVLLDQGEELIILLSLPQYVSRRDDDHSQSMQTFISEQAQYFIRRHLLFKTRRLSRKRHMNMVSTTLPSCNGTVTDWVADSM